MRGSCFSFPKAKDAQVFPHNEPKVGAARLSAIVFDFDGVLADSFEAMLEVMIRLSDEFGLVKLNREEVERLRGESTRDILRHMGVPWWKLPAMMRRGLALAEADTRPVCLFSGTELMLKSLKAQGVMLAIVSSSGSSRIKSALGSELTELISVIDGGASLLGKTRRLKNLARYWNRPPASMAYVGDESRDIEAAIRAGFMPIGVSWGYGDISVLERAGAIYIAEDRSSLSNFLSVPS